MQKKIMLLALAAVVLLLGSTARAQDFYVVAGGGPPVGTKITSLPYTINGPGFYFLAGNLSYTNTTGVAITINHNDVTLDLMGFILVGTGANSSATGIYMSSRYNVEVRNGTVAGFFYGVHEDSANGHNHRIINIRATFNTYGLVLAGADHLIKNCLGSDNTLFGIHISGPGALIADNVANNNVVGITMYGPGSFLGNTACNNSDDNFFIGNGTTDSILVDRNSAFGTSPNYYIDTGTTGVVITANNSGTP
jgi:hypothetical protein